MIIAQLFWGFLAQMILNAAQNAGGDALKSRLGTWLERAAVQRKVKDAVTRVMTAFRRQSTYPTLIQLLFADPSFERDPAIASILADAAFHPLNEAEHTARLAEVLQRHAPTIAHTQCAAAAGDLIRDLHREIAGIPALSKGLSLLTNREQLREMGQRINLPPYTDNLKENLLQLASQAQADMKHGYITTAHLLLASDTLPESLSALVLQRCDVTPERLRDSIRRRVQPYSGMVPGIPVTESVYQTFDAAQRIAQQQHAPRTRDDHVLLALLNQFSSSDSLHAIFLDMQMNLERVSEMLLNQGRIVSAVSLMADPPVIGGEPA